jgi:hypothetical protein
MDGGLVGTRTTNAVAGTWPSETLRFATGQFINSVVVNYDKPPVTGRDWGPIFMADNMAVTPAPLPCILSGASFLPDNTFQFTFTNFPNLAFTVLSATNATLPLRNWIVLGPAVEVSPGRYQFNDSSAATNPHCLYCVRQP